MSRRYTLTAFAVALGLAAGACSEQADPTSVSDTGITGVTSTANLGRRVLHRVSLAGADGCEGVGEPTGCDANFSLTANKKADGTVTGQWQDTWAPFGGEGIHVAIDCLHVDGNGAVIGGVITHGTDDGVDISGRRALTVVFDNGTSANDPPDLLGFSEIDTRDGFPQGSCEDVDPDDPFFAPLFTLAHGQVKVR